MRRRRAAVEAWRRRASWCLAALVCVTAVAVASPAYAHVPEIAAPVASDASSTTSDPYPSAQPIGGPTVSRAVYGFLAPGRDFDAYRFTVDSAVSTTVDLLVPARSDYAGFEPRLSIYEEGSGEERAASPGSGEAEYEPFSIESFREVQTADLELVPGNSYYLVVRSGPRLSSGPYVLAFSGAESFGSSEIGSTLLALPVIWSGAWAGAPPRPAAYGCCGSLFVILALVTVLTLMRRRRLSRIAAGQ